LGVVDFLIAVRCFPGLFGFGNPVWVGASRCWRIDGMVQVVVDGRDLESVRQFEDLFDVVEPVVILDDESILDGFRKPAEIQFEALKCFFFIPINASDMEDDFIGVIGVECGQDFVVVNQIRDGARDDVFVRRIQDGVLARVL